MEKPKIIKYELILKSYFKPDNTNYETTSLNQGLSIYLCDYFQKQTPNTISEKLFDELVTRFKIELIVKGLITKDDNYIV